MQITIPTHNGEFTYTVTPLPSDAPKLMPFQELPFNGDTIAQAKVIELRDKFDIENAIETGTCFGSTTQFLAQVFDRVDTIESNRDFINVFGGRRNVTWTVEIELHEGSSAKLLKNAIYNQFAEGLTLFFLDAHWEKSCPLKEELAQIADAVKKEDLRPPVIMIHDWKVPDHPELGFDSYNGQDFEWTWIKPGVDMIYGIDNYDIEFNSEATGAKRGILYITPKQS